jgi:hypothetical protein
MKKIPIFQPFKDVNQGFERLSSIIERIDNVDAKVTKYEMIIWAVQFHQTYNEHIEKLYDKWANGEDEQEVLS